MNQPSDRSSTNQLIYQLINQLIKPSITQPSERSSTNQLVYQPMNQAFQPINHQSINQSTIESSHRPIYNPPNQPGGCVQPGEHQPVSPGHPADPPVVFRRDGLLLLTLLILAWRRSRRRRWGGLGGKGLVRLREAPAHRGGGDAKPEQGYRRELLPYPGGPKLEHAAPSYRHRSSGEHFLYIFFVCCRMGGGGGRVGGGGGVFCLFMILFSRILEYFRFLVFCF